MRELPILMNTPMVVATLADLKKETRRPVKPQPPAVPDGYYLDAYSHGPQWNFWTPDHREANSLPYWKAPYQVGDRLWVRETWLCTEPDTITHFGETVEMAPGVMHYRASASESDEAWLKVRPGGWKPSIHMPKWAARIWLEVTGVRVERLQDITEEGVAVEGFSEDLGEGWYKAGRLVADHDDMNTGRAAGRWAHFAWCWDRIYDVGGKGYIQYSWGINPWVWVIQFKRAEPATLR